MNVVMTQAAIADLLDIGHWIGLEYPDRAVTFVDELEGKCLDLAEKPLLYPLASEIGPDIRKRRHRKYLIVYRIVRDRIEVLHVVHGARDHRKLFTSI
jgi:toxin ParE1/3/4